MRITERRLRSIIRSVIKEAVVEPEIIDAEIKKIFHKKEGISGIEDIKDTEDLDDKLGAYKYASNEVEENEEAKDKIRDIVIKKLGLWKSYKYFVI